MSMLLRLHDQQKPMPSKSGVTVSGRSQERESKFITRKLVVNLSLPQGCYHPSRQYHCPPYVPIVGENKTPLLTTSSINVKAVQIAADAVPRNSSIRYCFPFQEWGEW